MVNTMITAVASYIGTSIDYIIVLVILFSQLKGDKKGARQIVWGQYIGLALLILISVLVAYGLTYIQEEWIGFLGLVPIFLGLKVAFSDEDEEAEEMVESSLSRHNGLLVSMVFLMFALGGDNLGVYIPLFASFSVIELVTTIIIYFILAGALLYMTFKLSEVKEIEETVEKYEKIIVPIVFIGLGLFIMWENNTFVFVLNLFGFSYE